MEIWERMTPEERERVVQSLPSEFDWDEAAPPEGDPHFNAKVDARKTLGRFFERTGRRRTSCSNASRSAAVRLTKYRFCIPMMEHISKRMESENDHFQREKLVNG